MPRKEVEPTPPRVQPSLLATAITLEPISYDIKTAALVTHATEFYIGCAIRNGQLPAKKLGKKFVILRADLQRFVEQAEAAA